MQNPYEHIEAYLAGTLSPEHKAAFESAMANDNQLQQAADDFGFMDLIGEALVEKEISRVVGEELSEADHDEEVNPSKKSGGWIKWLIVLLAMAALWAINNYVIQQQEDQKHEELMAQYVFPDNRGTRSLSTAATKLDSAIYLFDLRKFDESKVLFLEVLEQDSLNQDANFYMANVSFLEKEYKSAKIYCKRSVLLNSMCDLLEE